MKYFFVFPFATLLMIGCQSSTVYKQAQNGQFGYSDTKLDDKIYRVNFRGNSITSRETVETYMMYRVAQLTLEKGYTHFKILSRDHKILTSFDSNYRSNAFLGPYVTGYYGFNSYRFPYYSYGYPWSYGYGFNIQLDTRRRYESIAYVKVENITSPANVEYQNADLVIKFLMDKITFPKKNSTKKND